MPILTADSRPDDSMPPTQLVAGGGPPPRKVIILVGLIVALLAVIVGTAVLLQGPRTSKVALAATATYALLPTGVPVTPSPEIVKGWTVMDSTFSAVAFAPSLPRQGFGCGAQYFGTPPKYGFGVSSDGGTTWHKSDSPQSYPACTVTVSPTNPHVVLLVGYGCFKCYDGSEPPQWFFSRDSGAHWSQDLATSASAITQSTATTAVLAGNNLYVINAQDRNFAIAVSKNGAPFQRLATTTLFASVPAAFQLGSLQSYGSTLYATLVIPKCQAPTTGCTMLAKSLDGGVTWVQATLTLSAPELYVIPSTAGAPLLGSQNLAGGTTIYLRSFDAGTTWTRLPYLPTSYFYQNANDATVVLEAPDGTLFASTTTNPADASVPNTVLRLTPGATAWANFAQMPGQGGDSQLEALATDAQGHPLAVWCAGTVGGLYARSST